MKLSEQLSFKLPCRNTIHNIIRCIMVMIFSLGLLLNGFYANASNEISSTVYGSTFIGVSPYQWFYEDIMDLYQSKIIISENSDFKPFERVKTATFLQWMLRASGKNINAESDPFYREVEKEAKNLNMVTGTDKYYYGGDLNRKAAAKIICNSLKLDPETSRTVFSDTNDAYAQALYDHYILRPFKMKGMRLFKPEKALTKAEAACLAERVCEYKKSPEKFKAKMVAAEKETLRLPIITYHSLTNNEKEWNNSNLSPQKFENDMVQILKEGYSTINFNDLTSFIDGFAVLPQKPLIVTFDDGYYNNYEFGYPIAKKLKIKMVISVIGKYFDRKYVEEKPLPAGVSKKISSENMHDMFSSGLIEFQNHTFDLHNTYGGIYGVQRLSSEKDEDYTSRLYKDFMKCNRVVEDILEYRPQVLTYPGGYYNPISEKEAKLLGFDITLTVKRGMNHIEKSGLYAMKRINVPYDLTSSDLLKMIDTL